MAGGEEEPRLANGTGAGGLKGMLFSAQLDALSSQNNGFLAVPTAEWRQGRTLFGGLSAALAVAAARKKFPDLPPLRSAQFVFVAAAKGALEIVPRLLRAGKSAAFVEVRTQSESETVLSAMLVFGVERRSSHVYRHLPMPEVPGPGALPEFFDGSFAPVFARQFETGVAGGARAVSGAEKPELLLWLRHRDPDAPDNIMSILALGDAPPPAAMTMFTAPSPVSTISWSVDVLAERFTGAAWHLAQVQAETVAGGYSSQRLTLWDRSGEPVLVARQTVAVFA